MARLGITESSLSEKYNLDSRESKRSLSFPDQEIISFRITHAVVAANTSILLALATVANVNENRAVKSIVTANRAKGFLTKYRMRIDVVGSRDESTVLIEFAAISRGASS